MFLSPSGYLAVTWRLLAVFLGGYLAVTWRLLGGPFFHGFHALVSEFVKKKLWEQIAFRSGDLLTYSRQGSMWGRKVLPWLGNDYLTFLRDSCVVGLLGYGVLW